MAVRAAAAAATLLAAALTAGASVAYAEPGDSPTVEFYGGGAGPQGCRSAPSVSHLDVQGDTQVTFVNRLGRAANLLIGNNAVKSVGAGQAVSVTFHQGLVEVSMTYECGGRMDEQFESVGVAVSESPSPSSTPSDELWQGTAIVPTTPATPYIDPPLTDRPSTDPPSTDPASTDPAATTPNAAPSSAAGGAEGDTQGAAGDDGTGVAEEPTPDESGAEGVMGVTSPSDEASPTVAMQPMLGTPGPESDGPAGLLALIAVVCAVGVGIAAIRAFIGQKGARASLI